MTTQLPTEQRDAPQGPAPWPMAIALDEIEAQARYNAMVADRIAAVIRDHMQPGVHYTYKLGETSFPRPVLLDAGVAYIMSVLRLVPRHHVELALREPVPVQRPDGGTEHRLLIKYVVRAELWHISPDGRERLVAEGLGSASSFETRHLYRWVSGQELPAGADPSRLPSRGQGSSARYRVYNPDPDDLDNTILKMAAKRAEADAIRQLPGVLEACALLPDAEVQAGEQPPHPLSPRKQEPQGEAQSAPSRPPSRAQPGSAPRPAAPQQAPTAPERRQRHSQTEVTELAAERALMDMARDLSPEVSVYVTIARLLGLPEPERGRAAIVRWLQQHGRTWQDALQQVREKVAAQRPQEGQGDAS